MSETPRPDSVGSAPDGRTPGPTYNGGVRADPPEPQTASGSPVAARGTSRSGPRVAVLGLGLIGGSLLRRLTSERISVIGYDGDADVRRTAGGTYRVAGSVAEAVRGTDVVVCAVPEPALAEVLTGVAAAGFDGVLTDVTSMKVAPARLAATHCPAARFVGGHPMAGTERSGFAAGDGWLFDGCAWVLCLEEPSSPAGPALADWLTVAGICLAAGARVVPVPAAEHDTTVAAVSHLPHLLAAALANRADDPLAATLAAGSFRDGTRVAATRPALTAAMCGRNASAVLRELDLLLADLTEARTRLTSDDPIGALEGWLAAPAAVRQQWPPTPGPVETLPVEHGALLALGRAGGWIDTIAADGRTVGARRPSRS